MIKQKGSILILILWVLIILSLLSIAISYRASGDIKLAKYESENIKALYLAKAGITKMTAELNKDDKSYTSLNGEWAKEKEFSFGGGKVIYRAYDEEARFNLNNPNLRKEHLIKLGLDDKLLDYKTQKGEKGFEFMEELFLIGGITKDIYSSMKDYVTIYRGNSPKININTASESVLNIALDDYSIIQKIIEFRNGNDGKSGTKDDGIFNEADFSIIFKDFGVTPADLLNYQSVFSVKSIFFRITADVSFSEDKKIIKQVTAVIDRNGKIYYWKEE